MENQRVAVRGMPSVRSILKLDEVEFTNELLSGGSEIWSVCDEVIIRAATVLNSLGMMIPLSMHHYLRKFKDEVSNSELWFAFRVAGAVIQASKSSPVDEEFHIELATQKERSYIHHDHIVNGVIKVDPTYVNLEPLMEVQLMQQFGPFKDGYRRVIALEFTDDDARNIRITYHSATDDFVSRIIYRDPETNDFLVMEHPDNKANLYCLNNDEQYTMSWIVTLMGE